MAPVCSLVDSRCRYNMVPHKSGYWLGVIILVGLVLRLYPHVEFDADGVRFVGTCGQLIDVVNPLVRSGNLLNFEVFFYPPVAPLIVAGTARFVAAIIPVVANRAQSPPASPGR